jgi:hypothetical protein
MHFKNQTAEFLFSIIIFETLKSFVYFFIAQIFNSSIWIGFVVAN